jgi:hypothetical protein
VLVAAYIVVVVFVCVEPADQQYQDICGNYGYLHNCFAERRIRGEWFDLGDEEVQEIVHFLDGRSGEPK